MELISLCLPTRGRPERFARAIASAQQLARNPVEVVAWVDDDDPALPAYLAQATEGVKVLHGPREVQSNLWNRCWAEASGDIAMLCADDVLFRTPGWDRMVRSVFNRYPDRIALAYGDDGSRWREATLPFVSREWIETAGYFTPPYFKSWFADRWIWEIAYLLGRKVFLPRLRITHEHATTGKGPKDQTFQDGVRFREEQHPKELYFQPEMLAERCEQAVALSRRIHQSESAAVA